MALQRNDAYGNPGDESTSMTYNSPMYTFIELPMFSRFAADCLEDDELAELQRHLTSNPEAGAVVPGSGGVRKLRGRRAREWASGAV